MRLCRAGVHQDAVAGFREARSGAGDRRVLPPRAPLRCLRWLALMRSSPSSLRLRVLRRWCWRRCAVAAVWFGSPWLPLADRARRAPSWPGNGRGCAAAAARRDRAIVLIGVVLAAVAALPRLAGAWLAASRCWPRRAGGRLRDRRGASRIASRDWLGARRAVGRRCLASVALAGAVDGRPGALTLLWIFAVVWATDIGAYASAGSSAGRSWRRAEPAQDLVGPGRRRCLRRAGRLGGPRGLLGLSLGSAAGAGQRGTCDCRAVRRSCGVGGQAKVRREGPAASFPDMAAFSTGSTACWP